VDWRSCLDLDRNLGKLPLRHALARHVRRSTETKRGFEAPMKLWLKGPLKDIFQQTVCERQEIVGLPVNPAKVRVMYQEHTRGVRDYTRELWTILSLALWEKRHYCRTEQIESMDSCYEIRESCAT
jgi:asparagine synthase (glutamine-hydrolysing)